MTNEKNYYELLQLAPDASQTEVDSRIRFLKTQSIPQALQGQIDDIFATLGDMEKRRAYNASLALPAPGQSAQNPYARSPQAHNPYQAPTVSSNPDQNDDIPLYSPVATAIWSVLLTPLLGSILFEKNWRALGEEEEANKQRIASYCFIAFYALIAFLSFIPSGAVFLEKLPPVTGVIVFVTWWLSIGRQHHQYVKNQFGGDYPRRGLVVPVLATIGGLFLAVFVLALIIYSLYPG